MDLFIGSLLGFGASCALAILGAWLQSKREHRKWVREKRFEHVLRILRIASLEDWHLQHGDEFDRLRAIRDGGHAKQLEAIEARFIALKEAVNELALLGPDNLHTLAMRLIVSAEREPDGDGSKFHRALREFSLEARRTLRLK